MSTQIITRARTNYLVEQIDNTEFVRWTSLINDISFVISIERHLQVLNPYQHKQK